MKNLFKLLKKDLTVWLVVILLGVLSAVCIYKFKLNLGADFSGKTIMKIELNYEENSETVRQNIAKIFPADKIEQQNNNKFLLYFTNLPANKETELKGDLANIQKGISNKIFYSSNPPIFYQIKSRLLSILGLTLLAYAVYLFFTLRSLGLSRKAVLVYVKTDFLVLAWQMLLMLGLVSLAGQIAVSMDEWFFSALLAGCLLIAVSKIFMVLRYKDYLLKFSADAEDLSAVWRKFIAKDWPTLVYLVTVLCLLAILPFFVLGYPLTIISFLMIWALLLIFAEYTVLKIKVFQLLEKIMLKITFLAKAKALNKKW